MVRFEKSKLIIEVETSDPFDTYLGILNALFVVGWYVTQEDKDRMAAEEYSVLAYSLGQALSKMDGEAVKKIEKTLIQK